MKEEKCIYIFEIETKSSINLICNYLYVVRNFPNYVFSQYLVTDITSNYYCLLCNYILYHLQLQNEHLYKK